MSRPSFGRRRFLGSLSLLAAGMALDPDRMLWVQGRKTYFDLNLKQDWKVETLTLVSVDHYPERGGWGYTYRRMNGAIVSIQTYWSSPFDPYLKPGDTVDIERFLP